MTFRLGQKVVCIDDIFVGWDGYPYNLPKYGEVYTVRNLIAFAFSDGVDAAIRVYEIHNPVLAYCDGDTTEIAFGADRFRPVATRETNISCFKALLNPAPKRELVR